MPAQASADQPSNGVPLARAPANAATSPSASALRRAALAHLVGLLVLALVLVTRRPWMIAASLSAIVLMQLYSYAPVRLSHRGGGEWLQGAGIGLVLPWVGFYLVTGDPRAPLAILLPMVLFGVAGNISTAVPDLSLIHI